jgi:hypothetical protein
MKFPEPTAPRSSAAIQAEANLQRQQRQQQINQVKRQQLHQSRSVKAALVSSPPTAHRPKQLSPLLHDRHVDNLSFQLFGQEAYLEQLARKRGVSSNNDTETSRNTQSLDFSYDVRSSSLLSFVFVSLFSFSLTDLYYPSSVVEAYKGLET